MEQDTLRAKFGLTKEETENLDETIEDCATCVFTLRD